MFVNEAAVLDRAPAPSLIDPSDPIARVDAAHARVGSAELDFLAAVAGVDRAGAWRDDGARDTAHWLAMRYGLSFWKAHRLLRAAHVLPSLPRIAEALRRGVLGLDKVLELCRFATPETEERLIDWARRVACWAVRRRGDRERAAGADVAQADRERSVSWWYMDGHRFGLEAYLPADQGAVVVKALQRAAERVPRSADPDDVSTARERYADALVGMCSSSIASDPDSDRATVVVHVRAEDLAPGAGGAEVEDGPVVPGSTLRRLGCDARVQTVVEDEADRVVGLGTTRREPPAWMLRQLRWRDTGCRFPGCGTRAFTHAHHIVHWADGGPTELSNLVLVCSFHHRLVHEHRWRVRRAPDGDLVWLRPGGVRYRAGPAP